jgi:nicotinamidase-related amidase
VLILVKDAVCSSSDEGHDALLSLFARRYSQQVDTADAEAVLSAWPSD